MSLFKQTFADQLPKFQIPAKPLMHKIPLSKWIRTELYEKIKDIFETDVAREFFNVDTLLLLLERHRKGFRDLSRPIWATAMFIIWLKGFEK